MQILTATTPTKLRSSNPIRRQEQLMDEHRNGELSTAECGLLLGMLHHQLTLSGQAANEVWAALYSEEDA